MTGVDDEWFRRHYGSGALDSPQMQAIEVVPASDKVENSSDDESELGLPVPATGKRSGAAVPATFSDSALLFQMGMEPSEAHELAANPLVGISDKSDDGGALSGRATPAPIPEKEPERAGLVPDGVKAVATSALGETERLREVSTGSDTEQKTEPVETEMKEKEDVGMTDAPAPPTIVQTIRETEILSPPQRLGASPDRVLPPMQIDRSSAEMESSPHCSPPEQQVVQLPGIKSVTDGIQQAHQTNGVPMKTNMPHPHPQAPQFSPYTNTFTHPPPPPARYMCPVSAPHGSPYMPISPRGLVHPPYQPLDPALAVNGVPSPYTNPTPSTIKANGPSPSEYPTPAPTTISGPSPSSSATVDGSTPGEGPSTGSTMRSTTPTVPPPAGYKNGLNGLNGIHPPRAKTSFTPQTMANHTHAPPRGHAPVEYPCDHPGCKVRPFPTLYLLNSHKNAHSDLRPFLCDHPNCVHAEYPKGFKRKNELNRHKLSHDTPGYPCPFCEGRKHAYPRPDNLTRHVKAQHKDRDADDVRLQRVLNVRSDGSQKTRRKRAAR